MKQARILIVDDVPANVYVLIETLKEEYALIVANGGEKALRLAAGEKQPDLILLDVMMEGMDGYEVCRRLKLDRRTRKIPVIFVTTRSEIKDETLGLKLGAVDYIVKPIIPAIVRGRVKNHLELKAHRDHLEELVEGQTRSINSARIATIFALSKLAESRDDDTGKHLERTQSYCKLIASYLRQTATFPEYIDQKFVDTIYWTSPLHDVGKVAISDQILCKPGKLTEEEFEVMKTHTTRGAETLSSVASAYPENEFISMGVDIARSHHEKWNGLGYPQGLAGDEIPLAARIMAIADVYDALTSKRCYKEAMSHQEALALIASEAGFHFDPKIAHAFMQISSEVDDIRQDMHRLD